MRLRIVYRATVAIALVSCFPAQAQRQTGNELLQECQMIGRSAEAALTTGEMFQGGVCAGYIAASMDYTRTLFLMGARLACLPQGTTIGQAVRVVVKYLEEHPERLHEGKPVLVSSALGAAFPCSDESKTPAP